MHTVMHCPEPEKQRSFRGETSGDVTKCRLFSQASIAPSYVFLNLLFNENAAIDALFIDRYVFGGQRSQEIMLLCELACL